MITKYEQYFRMSFLEDLKEMLQWLDRDAQLLESSDIIDGTRLRTLRILQRFVAYPHCQNFSLMPES